MSDTTKIPFSFCRLNRAAEFLGVTTADLLSLAVSEKITLCVRLDGLKSVLWVAGDADELTEWYLSLDHDYSNMATARDISKHSSFSIDRISYDERNDEPIFNPFFYQTQAVDETPSGKRVESHQGRAFGLWIPQLPVINSVLNFGKSPLLWGSLGLYRTNETTPSLCLVPIALNHDEFVNSEDEDECLDEIYPDMEITENDLWITSEQIRELLNHAGDYSELPNHAQCGVHANFDLTRAVKNVNHLAEHHATNREKLFKSAIFLLSKYPDECRGKQLEISPEKWRDCVLNRKDEIPPLAINNKEVILKHLRAAANGKQ